MNETPPEPRPGACGAGTAAELLSIAARLALGGVLLVSGGLKLGDVPSFYETLLAMELPGLGAASFAAPILATHLPGLEIGLGLLLLLGLGLRGAALVAAGLFAGFTAVLAHLLWWALPVDCGCLGPLLSGRAGGWHLALNLLGLGAALALALRRGHRFTLERVSRRLPA